MTRRLLRLLLVSSLVAPATAAAQLQTGEIFGRVTDTTGAVLPGATVTIDSPALLRAQSAVTTETGAYRFPNIPIGTYTVKFELAGFKTLVREGIRIETGFNAEINGRLEISTVQETITVSGESPVVDTKQVSTGGNFNREMLENIPSARDPWVILQMTPGIVMSGQNVGGSQSGQQNGYAAHGGGQGNSMWNVDGATITDMAATGASPIYYDFDSFEEIQITTGGSDASLQTGGVNINMVTKSGSNAFKGSGRLFAIEQALQADNVTQALFDQGAASGNPIQSIQDYGAEVGGPIVRDKAWFWSGYGRQDIRVGVLGFFKREPQCSPPPNTFDQLDAIKDCLHTDLTVLENYNAKLHYQLAAPHKLTFLFTRGDKIRNARGAGPLNPPETTFRQTGPVNMYKGTHNWIISDRLTFETAAMYVDGGFLLNFHEDALADVQRKFNITTELTSRSNQRSGPFVRPTTEVKTDGNYFGTFWGGDHSMKVGLRWRDTPFDSGSHVGGFATARYRCLAVDPADRTNCLNEVPIEADLHRDAATRTGMWVASAYVNDSYSRGRVRLTLGLRFDYQDDEARPSSVPENPIVPVLLPAVQFQGADAGVTYQDWSPRVSVTYDVRGNGKSVLKGSYARYLGQGIFTAGTLNPVGAVTLRYAWTDGNTDTQVQANELGARRQIFGNYNPDAPGSPTTLNRVDPDLKNDRVDEAIVSLDHELMANFGVGASYIYRRYDQFARSDRVGISSADYVPVTYVESDARFASRTPVVTYYQLRSGLTLPQALFRTTDTFYRRYHGLELTARKRMSDRWMLNGSLTLGSSKQFFPPGSFQDPTNVELLHGEPGSPLDTRWLFKAGGAYSFPWGVNASAFVNGRDGFLLNRVVQSPSRPGGLGRVDVLFEPQGSARYPAVWLLDARVEKWFTLRQLRFAASVDVFNIGNANTVVDQGRRVNATNYESIFEIIAPRVLRIGARFTF
jgi:hypothetical protein